MCSAWRCIARLVVLLALGALAPSEAGEWSLPPVDEFLPDQGALSAHPRVFVRAFRFEGNTVFADDELARVVEGYSGRELAGDELHQARRALTLHYVEAGYVNSGAVLPAQDIVDGVVTFRLVEGRLSDITITGNRWTRTSYIEGRIARGATAPLNLIRLKDTLEVLRQKPIFDRIKAELQPGTGRGRGRLSLDVEEARPCHVAFEFSNARPPSVGAERFGLLASHDNLTGHADALNLRWGLTTNGLSDTEFAGLDDFGVSYERPLCDDDTTLVLGYARSDTLLVEEPFLDLDITSQTETCTVGLRRPFYRTPNTEFAMSLALERSRNVTELLGERFSFSPGAEDGEMDVTVLRFIQEWATRNERRAVAARSTISVGLPILGATKHDRLPDSEFLAWRGQVQVVQRLGCTNTQAILRLGAQLAKDSLLSLEQFGIGGVTTVRGYRENEIVRDNAALASLEVRIPLIEQPSTNRPVLQLAPFVDMAYGWDVHSPGRGEVLASAGLGLLLNVSHSVDARLYWGCPFRDFNHTDHDIQDSGFHFYIIARPF